MNFLAHSALLYIVLASAAWSDDDSFSEVYDVTSDYYHDEGYHSSVTVKVSIDPDEYSSHLPRIGTLNEPRMPKDFDEMDGMGDYISYTYPESPSNSIDAKSVDTESSDVEDEEPSSFISQPHAPPSNKATKQKEERKLHSAAAADDEPIQQQTPAKSVPKRKEESQVNFDSNELSDKLKAMRQSRPDLYESAVDADAIKKALSSAPKKQPEEKISVNFDQNELNKALLERRKVVDSTLPLEQEFLLIALSHLNKKYLMPLNRILSSQTKRKRTVRLPSSQTRRKRTIELPVRQTRRKRKLPLCQGRGKMRTLRPK